MYFSDDTAGTLGTLKTPIRINEWQTLRAKVTLVADGFRPIFGRKSFDLLGTTIMQKPCPKIEINNLDPPCNIKMTNAKEFLELISRIVKSKHHTVNSKLTQELPSHTQTSTKIPVYLPPKLKIELVKFLNEEHFEKMSNCSDQYFISPIVIKVKR